MAARVIRYLSCHEETLYHGGKRAWQESLHFHRGSTIAPRDRVLGGLWSCPGWVCDHPLRLRSLSGSWSVVMSWGSLVMSWVCGHLLGLCSFPGTWAVVMSWMGLWSSPGPVVMSWVCGHFLTRGLWSYPRWVCGHLLGL